VFEREGLTVRQRRAATLFVVYVAIWVLEGALRRWLLPGLQELLFFARVPIVAMMVANSSTLNARSTRRTTWAWFLIVSVIAFGAVHVAVLHQELAVAVLGVRSYIEPWLVPVALRRDLLDRMSRKVLPLVAFAGIPMTLLALVQVNSPRSAFVNKIFLEGGADNFALNYGLSIRATGTFTSSAGLAIFCLLNVAAVCALWVNRSLLRSPVTRAVVTASAAVLVAIAGSRTALLGSLIIIGATAVTQAVRNPSATPRVALAVVALVGSSLYLAPKLAVQQTDGLAGRFEYEGAGSELRQRSLGAFTDWTRVYGEPPLLGVGLGTATQGLSNRTSTVAIEGELMKKLFEVGPLVFLPLLALRWLWSATLVRAAITALRRRDGVPASVVAAGLNTWLVGPATGQGSVTGFVAITATLVMASGVREVSTSKAEAVQPSVLGQPAHR
jgi:hypothetical protein